MKKRIYIIPLIVVAAISIAVLFMVSLKKQSEQNPSEFVTHSDIKTGIAFDYPIGWTRVGNIPEGYMFTSPEEKSIFIFSHSKISEAASRDYSSKKDLDREASDLLSPFKGNKNFRLISNISTKINNAKAKDITFSYRDREELLKIRLLVIGKYKGCFHYFTLYSSKAFEKDVPDFERIKKSIRFK
ncbi:MAG: hypothetical protein A2351_03015 [Omnitrophica bacterium RIFOXYB12_FULL_50_7]|nr:MAG: hypothetical protein A2351_03015 [Omnitrophica bacterium RIFOXYB12_FULL_50_7]